MTAITQVQGNALAIEHGILVHGCNCLGVMGGGIANSIRLKWPDVFQAYKRHQELVGLRLGDVNFVAGMAFKDTPAALHIHAFSDQLPPNVIVANAMTQQVCGSDQDVVYVSYDAISAVFARVALVARAAGLEAHFPLIGCGLANGKWTEVGPRIDAALAPDVAGTLWTFDPVPQPDPQGSLI
jgi:O-acetyl-ADP-ribose deacetylase (regulator of RNase III)